MLRFILTRLSTMILVLFVISIALFGLSRAAPGGPIGSLVPPDLINEAGPLIEAKIHEFGLDKPLPTQYALWMSHLLRGDLGTSFQFQRPVVELMSERVMPTLEMMGISLVLSTVIAVALGIWQARHKGSFWDYLIGAITLVLSNTPGFFLALLLIWLFAVKLGLLPSAQMSTPGDGSTGDLIRHLVLPVLTLTLLGTAGTARYVRTGMLEELNKDYVRTAVAQGATRGQAAMKAFRNSLVPIVTVVMLSVPGVLGGAVVLEAVFAWPGMGGLTLGAIQFRDYPVILGFGMTVALIVVLNNFVTDLLVAALDPRVRLR